MEILLGEILLLQVVILIQIMHGRNLVLQCFENVEKKMKAGEEAKETIEFLMSVYESGDGPQVYQVKRSW